MVDRAGRYAATTSGRTLRLVHIADASPEVGMDERIARIADESRVLGVVLEIERAPSRGARVAERLIEIVPERAALVAGRRHKET